MSDTTKDQIAAKIIVRGYSSEDIYTDDTYCVDIDGLLQYKHAEAKVGTKTYLTLADAIAEADTQSTVYVLKDIAVDGTIAIGSEEAPKELTITNIPGKNITITRTSATTLFTVAKGSALTLGDFADASNKFIVDGGYVKDAETPLTAPSLVSNAGTFVANDNVTIQNANAGTANGGVLYNTGKEAIATLNSTMTGNGAKQGAVAYNDKGTVTIKKGTYTQNIATQNGGVIYSANGAIVNIEGGLFDSNEAQTATGGVAGGNATTTITGGTFQNNKAANGASVLNIASGYTADISNATITGNSLVRVGTGTVYNGAIYISGSGQLTLENCDIHDNPGLFSSATNPECDVRLGASAVLNIKDNKSVGAVSKSEDKDGNVGTIEISGENIGTLILIPPKGYDTTGSKLVTFNGTMSDTTKDQLVAKIIVRKYSSENNCTDDTYCVDKNGLLQLK